MIVRVSNGVASGWIAVSDGEIVRKWDEIRIRVHRAVLTSGARISGATVHLVDERYDEGGIVAQWPVPVLPTDTPEELAARVLQVEHQLLPLAVEMTIDRSTRPTRNGPARGLPRGLAFDLITADAPSADTIRGFLLDSESI